MDVLRFPLSRIALSFAAGIGFEHFTNVGDELVLTLCVLSLGVTLALARFGKSGYFFGLSVLASAFLAGAFCAIAHNRPEESHYLKQPTTDLPQALRLEVREKLKTTASFKRYVCNVIQIDGTRTSGLALLNVRNKKNELKVGTEIWVAGKLIRHRPPPNPNQFDYGKYLSGKNIHAQIYTDKIHVVCINRNIWQVADALRHRILTQMEKSGFAPRELAVFAALLLGQQQEIDADIVRDYQFAGAVHILSVSGLHVGFVLLILEYCLKFIPKTPKWKYARIIFVVFGLWSFALIAGLSPSVVRSAAMFSLVAVGLHLGRSSNIFHTLLVSMLLILLFRPHFLFDVGFQLSYLALFFIVWLKPLFDRLWQPRQKILRYFWDIFAVSVAAQIGTLPLSLYYFHQFPGLFFVTNLVIIPFLGLLMGMGLLVSVWSLVSSVPYWIIWPLHKGIWLLDEIISRIAGLERFIFTDIPFTTAMLLACFALIFLASRCIERPQFHRLAMALCAVLLLQGIILATLWKKSHEREWVVLYDKKNSMIVNRNGLYAEVTTKRDKKDKAYEYAIRPFSIANFVRRDSIRPIQNILEFNGNRVLLIDSSGIVLPGISPDIILLTQSPKIHLCRLLNSRPKMVIADGTNYRSYVARWEATCRKQKIPFHATAEKGYYMLRNGP